MTDSITVTPTIYAVTIVCPLCQTPMTFKENAVNVCPNCGQSFVVKPAAPQWNGPPM